MNTLLRNIFRITIGYLIIVIPVIQAESTDQALANIAHKPKISIVVDDLGDNSIIAERIANLPFALTLAILPHTPFAQKISNYAQQRGHEIIMHLPMEAMSRPDLLGPGALFSQMQQTEFLQTFLNSADSIPNLVGFNNHMGSLLTQDIEKMDWLMRSAQQQELYFLDSKTTRESIAEDTAKRIGIAAIGRDIFLDHHQNTQQLDKILSTQLIKAKQIAQKKGHVVIICHPYPQTFQFLSNELPSLSQDYELVKLSQLLTQSETSGLPTLTKHEVVK